MSDDLPEYKVRKLSLYRMLAVANRVLKQFIRDRRTLAMMVIMPVIVMLVFGFALAGEVKNIPIIVDNLDDGFTTPLDVKVNLGNEILANLNADERVRVEEGNYSAHIDLVENDDYFAIIQFPGNFTELMLLGNATVNIFMDGTKPSIRASIMRALSEAIADLVEEEGLSFEETLAFGGVEYTALDTAIPAVMGYILTFLVLLISVLTAIREAMSGTKERLFTTPLTSVERILGYVLALSVFAMIESLVILLIAIYGFGTIIQRSLVLLLFTGFIYGTVHIFMAFLLSNFAKNEFQAIQLALIIAIPSLAISGMIIPVSIMPQWLQVVSAFVPLTYGIRIFEGIMLKGWGFQELGFEFLITGVLMVVFFMLAIITSKDHMTD